MNKKRTKLIFTILEIEDFIREYWSDILSIGLAILSIVLMLLEFWGIIKL
ncbi:MAG: hypothetical protein K1X72_23540 [Pyrinomonadaceae bacterium]|nr:hypothetical protein [Pyrinomonadaceae bacterium]